MHLEVMISVRSRLLYIARALNAILSYRLLVIYQRGHVIKYERYIRCHQAELIVFRAIIVFLLEES